MVFFLILLWCLCVSLPVVFMREGRWGCLWMISRMRSCLLLYILSCLLARKVSFGGIILIMFWPLFRKIFISQEMRDFIVFLLLRGDSSRTKFGGFHSLITKVELLLRSVHLVYLSTALISLLIWIATNFYKILA